MTTFEFTAAEREMARALAEQVVVARLERCVVLGHTESGRVIVEISEEGMTEAERFWFRR